ncbi:MAG: hypothetical protein ACSHX8_07955 [Opitutaceae bacterium]
MDQQAQDQYVASWKYLPVPYHPSDSGLSLCRKSLPGAGADVLIYGGTPELADLAT